MAAGRPLVVTNLDEQAKIVKKYNCGLVCEPNSKDMADKITILLKDKNLSTKMGENGRKAAVSEHNWQIRAKTIISKVFN